MRAFQEAYIRKSFFAAAGDCTGAQVARRRMRQTLEGSFSAVSEPNFASKYALEALAEIYTMHSFAEL